MTEAVIPNTSRIPRAPTGTPKLSRIEGQSRPRVELGKATLRYARQASRRAGTVRDFLVSRSRRGSPCRGSEQHAMTESDLVRQRVRGCPGTSAPRRLSCLHESLGTGGSPAQSELPATTDEPARDPRSQLVPARPQTRRTSCIQRSSRPPPPSGPGTGMRPPPRGGTPRNSAAPGGQGARTRS